MKLLAVMADLAQEHAGGALLRALHALSQQGSPQGRSLSLEMLRRASAPVAEMLVAFSCRGSLEDPHGEFFVRARPWPRGWPSDGGDGFDLWRDGYEVVAAMLPPFVSTDLAEVVLRAGKTINFLRHCCGDLGWADDEELRQLQEGLERHVASGLVSVSRVALAARSTSPAPMRHWFVLGACVGGMDDSMSHAVQGCSTRSRAREMFRRSPCADVDRTDVDRTSIRRISESMSVALGVGTLRPSFPPMLLPPALSPQTRLRSHRRATMTAWGRAR